ncbi:MAG: sugar transferase [Melioribacteraceae bacterium]|nr:sugar transferase [Melioribacteraceae bacterium]
MNKTSKILNAFFAMLLIVVLSPVWIIITMLLYIQQNGHPFYIQTRGMILDSNLIDVIKFRTINPESVKDDSESGKIDIFKKEKLKKGISHFAGWLRKSGLDELPQLINIVKGDMSFIGPRPLMIPDLEAMKIDYPKHYSLRKNVKRKPGITGLWQVFGDREKGIDDFIGLELFYEKEVSVFLRIKIVVATLFLLVFASNSDAILNNKKNKISQTVIERLFKKAAQKKLAIFSNTTSEGKLEITEDESPYYRVTLPSDWWEKSDYHKEKRSNLKKINFDEKNDSKSA